MDKATKKITTIQKSSAELEQIYLSLVERSHALRAVITDGICFLDKNFCVESANAEAERIFGSEEMDLQNVNLFQTIAILNLDTKKIITEKEVSLAIESNDLYRNDDACILLEDGKEIPISYTFHYITQNEGHPLIVLVIRDVSQQKKLEQILLERTLEAELRAEQRTAELIKSEDSFKKKAIELAYQATHDHLTGLPNRREFEKRLQQLLDNSHKYHLNHVMLYMDLDKFKMINDNCGHMAGDELLRQLAVVLQSKLRKCDILARIGGDEFGVLLRYCNKKQALRVAEQLCETIKKYRFVWEGKCFSLSVSIGMVTLDHYCKSLTSSLSKADAACYVAKNEGRNRIHVFEPDDAILSSNCTESDWTTKLGKALIDDAFSLFVQKTHSIKSTALYNYYEILVRMKDSEGHLVSPGMFLPAAEHHNVISQLDRWVINRACSILSSRIRSHKNTIYSINLSGHSLNDQKFISYVLETFERTSVPAGSICFELSESVVVSNLSQTLEFISTMKKIGCRVALDNFGSGTLASAYLKNLPVDFLKIDGSIVKGMMSDPLDRALVKSINEIGKVLGAHTIAEFVEDEQVKALLTDLSVDYIQGYAVAAPEPLETFLDNLPS